MSNSSTKRRKKRDAGYMADGLPWNERAEKEIQRLRAAMVHAMDDCEAEANQSCSMTTVIALLGVAQRLRSALEKR